MCLTCDIIKKRNQPPGGIIYEDNYVIVCHCLDVKVAGYITISPVRHIEKYHELSETEIAAISLMAKYNTNILYDIKDVERVYIYSLGEGTMHFHFHIFPRYKWMRDIKDSYWENKLCGDRVISYFRGNYRIQQKDMNTKEILNLSAHIREKLNSVINENKYMDYLTKLDGNCGQD